MSTETTSSEILYSALGKRAQEPVIADLMHRALANPQLLSLAAGFTDNETLPHGVIEKVVAELQKQSPDREYLQYCSNQGRHGLLEVLASRLNGYAEERSNTLFDIEQLLISNGSQQTLYLAMQTLCDPSDIVLVEEPSYFVFLELLQGLGIEAVGIPSLQPEAIETVLKTLKEQGKFEKIKAVYIEGYFANPTGRSLADDEKHSLAAAMKVHGLHVPVIEDAAYRELYFETPHPAASIFSLEAFDAFPKLYLGTFTKPFATGLKIGYGVCSDSTWRSKMLSCKGHQDFGSANFSQAIIESVIRSGEYEKHLQTIRAHYKKKSDIMGDVLAQSKLREKGWSWEVPLGGLYYWLKGPENIDTRIGQKLCEACIDAGVLYVPGDLCIAGANQWNYIRLSFGALPVAKLKEATERFVKVVEAF